MGWILFLQYAAPLHRLEIDIDGTNNGELDNGESDDRTSGHAHAFNNSPSSSNSFREFGNAHALHIDAVLEATIPLHQILFNSL